MNLIKFNNFFYRYKGNHDYALNDININIQENRFILLAGETGSGKTSLIRCMNGLIPQFYPGYYKGSVEVGGFDTTEMSIANLSTITGIVFQNPENQLIAMNVEHEIAFGLENLSISKEEISRRINECVVMTEIEHLLHKAPYELSGGEQQRVALASILALEPKILVLDEPTALLDPSLAKKILSLLKKIQEEKEITIIISEHRMDLVMPLVDEIILMKDGKVIEHENKENVMNSKNFNDLNISHPFIYSIFNDLRKEGISINKIPSSIPEAIRFLQENIKK
ncbi:MAG: energy-coupling factor ABC transporter ATP-binding protein [Promethearchaeota archaeon]